MSNENRKGQNGSGNEKRGEGGSFSDGGRKKYTSVSDTVKPPKPPPKKEK